MQSIPITGPPSVEDYFCLSLLTLYKFVHFMADVTFAHFLLSYPSQCPESKEAEDPQWGFPDQGTQRLTD